jgi:hypothetical protein
MPLYQWSGATRMVRVLIKSGSDRAVAAATAARLAPPFVALCGISLAVFCQPSLPNDRSDPCRPLIQSLALLLCEGVALIDARDATE